MAPVFRFVLKLTKPSSENKLIDALSQVVPWS